MNIAVIDLGTNTFNLLLAEVENEGFKVLYSTKIFVQLGKGGINHSVIQKEAIARALKALTEFKELAIEYDCHTIKAIATSAVRSAKNGKAFIDLIKTELDLDIEVIDGDREAQYIYAGARKAVKLGNEKTLIMDVGGGSTEFIICDEHQIYWKQSFEVGAARLYEQFHHQEPITSKEIEAIEAHLHLILSPLFQESKLHHFTKLVGCSGAFTSFAAVIQCDRNNIEVLQGKKHYQFDIDSFKELHKKLVCLSLEERLKIPGLIKERAPMIVVGSILVNYILSNLPITSFELSRYSLKEGVIYEHINE